MTDPRKRTPSLPPKKQNKTNNTINNTVMTTFLVEEGDLCRERHRGRENKNETICSVVSLLNKGLN